MKLLLSWLALFSCMTSDGQSSFVQRKQGQFILNGKPYRYIGTNYWYGGLLPLQKDSMRGIARLKRELDFLASKGVTNLRLMAGAEGKGMIAGLARVEPPLQVERGVFDTSVLVGLDVLLNEMRKRNMKAVIFFSNNWEWSGGFLQYLQWNGIISDSVLRSKMSWDDMRDHISKFYTCRPCIDDYKKQVCTILERRNTINGIRYIDDPVIMAWELANEPRPMRPASNTAYKRWISEMAGFIKSKDDKHLVCIGHEGEIGTEGMRLFEEIHADKHIDYLTIHIWPKNWEWMKPATMNKDFGQVIKLTHSYINRHLAVAKKLSKPMVIEEFGFPRDDMRFSAGSATSLRDRYYRLVFSTLNKNSFPAGINFWAFNGTARPTPGQAFWKTGDDYMGDPPMEEQSLYGVFDNDISTWKVISEGVGLTKPAKKNKR
jgi:mannan endo-1,4-beta-mannosidase